MLRRIEPLTGLLVLACAGWTLLARARGWTEMQAGALRTDLLWDGQYWRLLTAALLHDLHGWSHLVLNLVGLLLIGPMVAQECGRRTYAVCLFFSVMAGWVASLGWYPSLWMWHLGISGGLLGLVGLLLAVEWGMASGWKGFLKQRNTWVLLAVVVLGAAFAEYLNRSKIGDGHLFTSQAGHAGGLAFGLLFGLFLFGRPRCRRRPVLGAVAVILFGVLPVAYLAFPVRNERFLLYRGERAWADGKRDRAAFFFGLALGADEGNPLAGARLAVQRDDPALLGGLRPPEDLTHVQVRLTQHFVARALLDAHLRLARERLAGEPAAAAGLVEAARGIHPADPELWAAFAQAAEAAGRDDLAVTANTEAMNAQRASVQRAVPALAALEAVLRQVQEAPAAERLALALRASEIAAAAAHGMAELDAAPKALAEAQLAKLGLVLARVARDEDPDGRLAGNLAKLFWLLANNSADPSREAAYLWHRALVLDREAVLGRGDPEQVRTAMKGVLGAAAELGDAKTEALARAWYAERGLPAPDLAPPGGGR